MYMTSGGNNLNDFPENQLTKFSCSLHSTGQSGNKSLSSVVYAGLAREKMKSQILGSF